MIFLVGAIVVTGIAVVIYAFIVPDKEELREKKQQEVRQSTSKARKLELKSKIIALKNE